MLIYLFVQIRFRYHVAKYFLTIFKKAGLTRRLWQENRVFLIGKRGCRDLGVSPTKMASVYDL